MFIIFQYTIYKINEKNVALKLLYLYFVWNDKNCHNQFKNTYFYKIKI